MENRADWEIRKLQGSGTEMSLRTPEPLRHPSLDELWQIHAPMRGTVLVASRGDLVYLPPSLPCRGAGLEGAFHEMYAVKFKLEEGSSAGDQPAADAAAHQALQL